MKLLLLACLSGFCIPLACSYGSETADAQKILPVASLTIRADWFDRGNVRVSVPGESYADKFACIWNAGALPNQSEYDIDFPVTAEYRFVALYTAQASRPVDIYVDDQKVHTGLAAVTGSWQTSSAKWETQLTLRVTQGKHTIKLHCPGSCMPHICALRLESPVPFPAGWKLDRPAARRRIEVAPAANSPGHLIPAVPLLITLDQGVGEDLSVEVLKADQYDVAGTESTNELLMNAQPNDLAELQTPWVARLTRTADDGSV